MVPMILFAWQEHSWWCSPLTDLQLSPNPAFCPLHDETDCFLNCCSILFSLRVWGFVHQKFKRMFCEVTYIVANLNLCSLGNGVYLWFSLLPQVKQKNLWSQEYSSADENNTTSVHMAPQHVSRCACQLLNRKINYSQAKSSTIV